MEQKTVLQWFQQLPEQIKLQAIANTLPQRLEPKEPSLVAAIAGAFSWSSTPQGSDYWFEIKARAANGEFNTPDDTIPWPPEADWSNAPEGTYGRSANKSGICRFFTINKTEYCHVPTGHICGRITDMTGVDWEASFEFNPNLPTI